ncbi:hypothetical protein GNI_113700 [Gregarina niphandrodes]|uniref:Uncharacterized protein n=1 Tax=Gregarina niphandrodes TaxID=110365 RepID=A0A023B368_GRENI|nr:hypothetical protein GNI_113700 [Gregarina niphandrodes]EZG55393.1 hypothetical protein GNI_113700 [Gregarina niphandrodes]|eukprot:XP_011131593.1 hypothetical protein GNI_113700 [Gregarina niphandrodes]
MSPFRSGDENYPPIDQIGRLVGLSYPPVGGYDTDDAGKDFINVHFDFYPEDWTEVTSNSEQLASLRNAVIKLKTDQWTHEVKERNMQKKLDANALNLLIQSLNHYGLLEEMKKAASRYGRDTYYKIPPSLPLTLLGNSLQKETAINKRLDTRDAKWRSKHKGDLDQQAVEYDSSWLDNVPDDLLAPIMIHTGRVQWHKHDDNTPMA